MKKTYVAFLRGINVGGNRRIKNTDLQKCFEALRLNDVTILLQSGNVIFSSASDESVLTKKIEKGLTETFRYPAKVIVKDIPYIRRIIERYPFDRSKTDHQHYVVFLSDDIASEIVGDATPDKKIEKIAPADKVVYWTVKKGMTLQTEFAKLLTKAKYKEKNTVRNINTLEKTVLRGAGVPSAEL